MSPMSYVISPFQHTTTLLYSLNESYVIRYIAIQAHNIVILTWWFLCHMIYRLPSTQHCLTILAPHIAIKSKKQGDKIEPFHEFMVLFVLRKLNSSNAHAQLSSGARCLIFGRTLRLLPYFMSANSEGSDETARMRRLAWAFAGRLCDKYHKFRSWLKRAT